MRSRPARSTIWSRSTSAHSISASRSAPIIPGSAGRRGRPTRSRNDALPGPDGIGTSAPLVTTGMVSPDLLGARPSRPSPAASSASTAPSNTASFATRNRGSHYGFIEEGVVFSKLQPGLATLSGRRRRRGRHEDLVRRRRPHAGRGSATPARTACRWSSPIRRPGRPSPARWSRAGAPATGPAPPRSKFRTLRAGACLQETAGRGFLIYGYFSTATPSAMARVFQAYGCRYAMQLDINALEHTYLALYLRQGDKAGRRAPDPGHGGGRQGCRRRADSPVHRLSRQPRFFLPGPARGSLMSRWLDAGGARRCDGAGRRRRGRGERRSRSGTSCCSSSCRRSTA